MRKYYAGLGVVLGTLATVFLLGTVLGACAAQLKHNPYYDGDPNPIELPGDSISLIRLTIENNRIHDATDPHFYLVGTGRHSLGIIAGMGGKKIQFVDTRWFAPDGCMTIIAHYPAYGDYTFPKFCWSPGYVIEVSLQEIFSNSSAWAHR